MCKKTEGGTVLQLVDRAAQQFRLMMYKSKNQSINQRTCLPICPSCYFSLAADGGRRAVTGAWIPVEGRKW